MSSLNFNDSYMTSFFKMCIVIIDINMDSDFNHTKCFPIVRASFKLRTHYSLSTANLEIIAVVVISLRRIFHTHVQLFLQNKTTQIKKIILLCVAVKMIHQGLQCHHRCGHPMQDYRQKTIHSLLRCLPTFWVPLYH